MATGLAPIDASATPQVDRLIADFRAEQADWQQFDIGNELLSIATLRDLAPLEAWLTHRDRHVRGNVAYLFAKKGDVRGLDTLLNMLADESSKRVAHLPPVETVIINDTPDPPAEPRLAPQPMEAQIREDRYYAVHLLGMLKDRRAVSALLPLLDDHDVNYKAAWALGEIGDPRAIPGLIGALSSPDAFVRVCAIGALQSLRATQALPDLTALFDDDAIPSAGDQVPVGVTARKAAAAIRARSVPP